MTRKRAYFWIMGVCIALIVLAWNRGTGHLSATDDGACSTGRSGPGNVP